MALDTVGILTAVQSHALASGLFDRVNRHEPRNPPGNGLTAAIVVNRIQPARSGLASTSALLILSVQVYRNMQTEPADDIDPAVLGAIDALMDAYAGDFELGGLVSHVDIRGSQGTPMAAQAGYLPVDDTTKYRIMFLTLPLVINDVWAEVA